MASQSPSEKLLKLHSWLGSYLLLLSTSCIEMLEAVNHHAAVVGMRTNASKTKVISLLIPGERRQAVLLDGEPLEDADRFIYPGFIFYRKRPEHRRDQKQDKSCPFRILSSAVQFLVAA